MNLDDDQKQAVRIEQSAVVSAGAGSGKTTVLTSRFVHLVKQGLAGVDQILTLTFTRKAAAEMYERIYRKLLQEAPEAARHYDQASISTLDSFSARIVRERCERFGLSRDFVQDDALVEELARSAALDLLLSRHKAGAGDTGDADGAGGAMERLIDLFGFETVLEELFVSLGKEYFTLDGGVPIEKELEEQYRFLQEEVPRLLEEARRIRADILALDPGDGAGVARTIRVMAEVELPEFSPGEAELEELISLLEEVGDLDARGLNGKKEGAGLCKEYIGQWRNLRGSLVTALETMKDWPLTRELGKILEAYRLRLDRAKRSAGVVTFKDVASMAVRLLEEEPGFRRRWKERFRYIMIDEFQDNNDLQRRLLYLLAEDPERQDQGVPDASRLVPGKLFFVGDEKQSIYRFRGADVGVFKRLSREIETAGGKSLELATNYRSEPELISFFNTFFPPIFGEPREDFEARFGKLASRNAKEGARPGIRLCYQSNGANVPQGEDPSLWLSAEEAEAWHIAGTIRGLKGEGRFDYRDMAILMRSGSSQITFERTFRRLAIPYNVQSPRALFLEAIAYDFYQFLQLLLYPEDRLAYTALLRSPFCALSDGAIASLVIRERQEHRKPFSAIPEEVLPPGDEQERYRKLRDFYILLEGKVDRVPATELLRLLWFDGGYRYGVLRRPVYHSYLEYYDYLVEIARGYDRKGQPLTSFLAFLRENLGKFEKIDEVELSRLEEPGVKMMSIHKSKGLQFPVVFVTGCGTTGHREHEGAKPYYLHPRFGLTLASASRSRNSGRGNYFHQLAKSCQEQQELAELKRLLYVAATRAEEQLCFSGYHGRNNRNMEKLGRFSFLNWIGVGIKGCRAEDLSADGWEDDPAFDAILETIPPVEKAHLAGTGTAHRGGVDMEEMLHAFRRGQLLSFKFPADTFSPSALAHGEPTGEDAGASQGELFDTDSLEADRWLRSEESITAFGTLCHHLVERGIKGIEFPAPGQLLPAPFRTLAEGAKEKILSDAGAMAERFLESPWGERAREAVRRGLEVSEVPFLYRTGRGRFIDGTMDLLLEDAGDDGDAVVIDFKSDRGQNPSRHLVQLALYKKAAEALTGKPVRCLLWYLRRGEAVELDLSAIDMDPDELIEAHLRDRSG